MTGGVTALVGAWILGPRIGKFNKDGSPNAIPGHNVPMVVLGTLILAFGWFGFNPGSTLAATDLRIALDRRLHDARHRGRLPQLDPLHVGRLRQARPDDGLQRPARRRRRDHRPVRLRQPGRRGDHRRDRGRPGHLERPVRRAGAQDRRPRRRGQRPRRLRRLRLPLASASSPTAHYGAGWNGVADGPDRASSTAAASSQLAAEAIGVAGQLPLGRPRRASSAS